MTKNIKHINKCCISPTEEYIFENEYVMSLERRIVKGNYRFRYKNKILQTLLIFYRIMKNIVSFIIERIKYRKRYIEIKKLKGIKYGLSSLVIGNGPSQGYLTPELIQKFKEKGGEIFVVNFWQLNKELSSVTPNYIVISDPATLCFDSAHEDLRSVNLSLLSYLKKNKSIKIICPFTRVNELEVTFGKDRILCFSDVELIGISNNISPIYPRGYISMTLFKALSVALWFGFKETYIVGMDNTYPRNIFCDSKNRVLNLEKHAGIPDSVVDQSLIYRNVAEVLEDLSILFKDIWKFSRDARVINIDEYSLTDAFAKLNINDFKKQILAD